MASHLSIDMILSLSDKISGPLKQAAKSVEHLGGVADKAAKHFTRLRNQTEQFAKEAKRLDGIGKPMLAFGAASAAGIGLTIAKYADLEEAQAALRTNLMDVTGKVGPEYEKLASLAERLGMELPGSTKDMLEMFTALREQGVQTNVILGGMGEAAAKFAVIMKIPFAEAAVSVAKLSEAMGVADEDSVAFMDTLQRLKSAGGVNVNDLTDTFRYSGAAMKALGIQGLEAGKAVSAAIGMMATSSIEGSVAGTSFAMALTRMAEVSSRLDRGQVKKLVGPILDAKNIDLNFFNGEGQFVGIRGMIAELEKLKAVNPQEQLLVLTKLFGQEAAKPLSVFINKGVTGFDEMNKRMAAQADMQKKITEIMGTSKMQFETMTGTAETLTANVGGMFAKLINLPAVLQRLNNLFSGMNDWILANPKAAGVIGGVVVAVSALSLVAGGFFMTLATIGAAIGPFLTGLAAFSRLMGMLNIATRIATAVQWAFNIALNANPIGLIIIGVAALAAAAYLIYKNWAPITAFFTRIWKAVVDVAGRMREAGANLIGQLWEGIKSMASKPIEAIKAIVQKIRNFLPFSPAKEGPLRDIQRVRIVETIADTMKPGPMVRAMRVAASATMTAASGSGGRLAMAGAGGATVNFSPTINLAAGSSADVRRQIDEALSISQAGLERMIDRVMAQKQRRAF